MQRQLTCRRGHPKPAKGRCRKCQYAGNAASKKRTRAKLGPAKVPGRKRSMKWYLVRKRTWGELLDRPCRAHGAPPVWGLCTFCLREMGIDHRIA